MSDEIKRGINEPGTTYNLFTGQTSPTPTQKRRGGKSPTILGPKWFIMQNPVDDETFYWARQPAGGGEIDYSDYTLFDTQGKQLGTARDYIERTMGRWSPESLRMVDDYSMMQLLGEEYRGRGQVPEGWRPQVQIGYR